MLDIRCQGIYNKRIAYSARNYRVSVIYGHLWWKQGYLLCPYMDNFHYHFSYSVRFQSSYIIVSIRAVLNVAMVPLSV